MVSQRRVKRVVALFIFGILTLCFIKYKGRLKTSPSYIRENKDMEGVSKIPIILLWKKQSVTFLADPEVCGVNVKCNITYDKNLLEEATAVVFHMYYTTIRNLPTYRSPDQLYVWWTLEATHHLPLEEYDNVFNLTFTYRTDSDIYAPYGSIHLILNEISQPGEPDIHTLMERKRKSGKMAIWAVSNCVVTYRKELTKDLEKFGVEVDKFGACYHNKIEGGAQFLEQISHYKFYFAFENSLHCKDYITEKFWFNGLKAGAVPIVWGPKKEDILKVAPTKSFIHVEDFETVEDLAKYILHLSTHEEEYMKYLDWRNWNTNPELIEERLRKENMNGDVRSFCSLCQKLHENEEKRSQGIVPDRTIVKSITKFWWRDENRECLKKARARAGFVDGLYKKWP